MVNKGAPTHAQSGHIYTVYAGGNQTAKGQYVVEHTGRMTCSEGLWIS